MNRCILLILALAVSLPVVMKSRPGSQSAARTAFSVLSSHSLVAVSGDVRHPGVYRHTANAVTGSVISMAGLPGDRQVLLPKGIERLPLRNGSDIRVTRNPDGTLAVTVGAIPTAQRIVLGIPLDMNVMTEADFERVPGIGPVLAERILEYRQFNGGVLQARDLLAIEGIGKATYFKLQKYF